MVRPLLVPLLAVAGCMSEQAAPPPSPAAPPPSPAAPPPSSAPPLVASPSVALPSVAPPSPSDPPLITRYAQATLARHPCRALDPRDLAALGITGRGKEESSKNGAACHWKLAGQNVSLDLDVPESFAKLMTKGGRITQVPVGRHNAVQAEFQRICFVFVAIDDVDHLVSATSIPDRAVAQDGTCAAGAAVVAAALTHLEQPGSNP
jgi:uncharacterized protein DUF3558